jgi:hypothetical protein
VNVEKMNEDFDRKIVQILPDLTNRTVWLISFDLFGLLRFGFEIPESGTSLKFSVMSSTLPERYEIVYGVMVKCIH